MDDWPIYYPERPDIPYDPTPETDVMDRKRSMRKLAEAGKRKGHPVARIPHMRLRINSGEKPVRRIADQGVANQRDVRR